MFQQPGVDVARFPDVQRAIVATENVYEPHIDDDAIVRCRVSMWGWRRCRFGAAARSRQGLPWVRPRRPFDSVASLPRSGHSPGRWLAMSEPSARRRREKASRMVEAAGVEFEIARFSKLVMARDFWC